MNLLKRKNTERLYWSKWPFKLVLTVAERLDNLPPANFWLSDNWSQRWVKDIRLNRKIALTASASIINTIENDGVEGFGKRLEGHHLSLFFYRIEEVEKYAELFSDIAIELWAPVSKQVEQEMIDDKTHTVYRKKYWYGKYPIRVKILFTRELRNLGQDEIRTALANLDDWKLVGQLYDTLYGDKEIYSIGQPYYIYLGSDEDAAMFRLLCDRWIDKFERIKLV